ncbi:MAG TPA: hypothetical protein VH025_08165 [Solirubrobacteraceae bacterium]|nr:hypothetical protein [Solirubrobacteraceae bacterium]
MAAKDKIQAAQSNRYVQRLIDDEDLRANLLSAYDAARNAYGRVSDNGKPPHQALMEDKKLQDELKNAARSLREVSGALREEAAAPRRRRRGRGLMLLSVAAVLAVAVNEGLRSKVLDAMFGKEEQFDYTSTTAPATPAPEAVTG